MAGYKTVFGWMEEGALVSPEDNGSFSDILSRLGRAVFVCSRENRYAVALASEDTPWSSFEKEGRWPIVGVIGTCALDALGDPSFCRDYRLRYPCYLGSMANGISSADMVEEAGRSGFLGCFGAAGLSLAEVEEVIDRLHTSLAGLPCACNLIHSPNEPELEAALAELYIEKEVQLIEASAFLGVTLPLVRYRLHGIHRDASGRIVTPYRIIAKVSRMEIAAHFFAPPPGDMISELLQRGHLSREQADLATHIPLAQDVTAEADSAGHTDGRSATTLLPTLLAVRDQLQEKYKYAQKLRVGLAGGIATPAAAASAFVMGAAYVCTGSVNQACVESGTCDAVRQMLAETRQADVAMAPAADMFEMGSQVQVLKRGTMFPMRAAKLYQLYRDHQGLDDLPVDERAKLERQVFRVSMETVWEETRAFFETRDPKQIAEAERDPKHKMGLVFRWYLGQSSRWAKRGEDSRKVDYQIWCGPAMGAFNEWVRGSFLEKPENRRVACVNLNLLFGAAILLRCQQARSQGVPIPRRAVQVIPRALEEIQTFLT